jgi:hypothetical protein
MAAAPLASGRVVISLEIPRSWARPHRVTLRGHDKFYARNSAGKYPVDVTELRNLFAQSEALAERMKRFRHERLAAIQAGETPLGVGSWPKVVLHLIPVQSFEPAVTFDLSQLRNSVNRLRPFQAPSWDYRYNFDGFATFTTDHQQGTPFSYLQVFRSGVVEAADRFMLDYSQKPERRYIPGGYFEQTIATSVRDYLSFLVDMEVQPPVFVALSLLGVQGYEMGAPGHFPFARPRLIDRADLILPEVAVEDPDVESLSLLRPVFDILLNAAGWPGSPNYTADGWQPR